MPTNLLLVAHIFGVLCMFLWGVWCMFSAQPQNVLVQVNTRFLYCEVRQALHCSASASGILSVVGLVLRSSISLYNFESRVFILEGMV